MKIESLHFIQMQHGNNAHLTLFLWRKLMELSKLELSPNDN